MTPNDLRHAAAAPADPALGALWWAARDEWTRAHDAAQSDDGVDAAWVHAYLHRVEGDMANAGYWYARAGRPVATAALTEEWHAIASALLRGDASDV